MDTFLESLWDSKHPYIEEEVNTSQQRQLINLPTHENSPTINLAQSALTCPNCGSALEGRKCKLFCPRPGCGYLVTCSEW